MDSDDQMETVSQAWHLDAARDARNTANDKAVLGMLTVANRCVGGGWSIPRLSGYVANEMVFIPYAHVGDPLWEAFKRDGTWRQGAHLRVGDIWIKE